MSEHAECVTLRRVWDGIIAPSREVLEPVGKEIIRLRARLAALEAEMKERDAQWLDMIYMLERIGEESPFQLPLEDVDGVRSTRDALSAATDYIITVMKNLGLARVVIEARAKEQRK